MVTSTPMRATPRPPAPEGATSPPGDALALVFPLAGGAIRLFVARASPLPPDSPALFFVSGLAQDLAVGLLLALLSRCLQAAGIRGGPAAAVAAVPSAILLAGHVAWAEAITFFGHPPRREDLEVALGADFLSRSAEPQALLRLGACLAGGGFATFLLGRILARRRRAPAIRLVAGAVVALAGTLVLHRLAPVPTANGVLLAALDLANEPRPEDAQGRATVPPPRARPETIRALAPGRPADAWLSSDFPLAARVAPHRTEAPRVPEGLRPNLVFVLLEGVRAREISCYGGPVPGLTPNLDRLAREGTRVERAYSPGTFTPQGEVAYWYGLLATPGSLLPVQNPDARLFGLPEILRAHGWHSFLWIHNGDESFYRRDRFYLPRGFRMVDGRDFPRSDVRTNWGCSDKALAQRAVDALDQTPEPFAAMVLTVSNHHPFQVPADAATAAPALGTEERGWFAPAAGLPLVGRHTVLMMKTIHYTDEAVGDLFRLAASRDWARRTVFVVSGDHGLPIVPVGGLSSPHELAELRHRVPLLIWSPLLPGGRVLEGPATLADVPPTLLGLLGIEGPRPFAGIDLFDPDVDLAERPLPLYDRDARRVTVLRGRLAYHARLEPPRTSAEWTLGNDILVDTKSDPRGLEDAAPRLPSEAARLRRDAETFVDVYPWLALSGRTGLPPEARTAPPSR